MYGVRWSYLTVFHVHHSLDLVFWSMRCIMISVSSRVNAGGLMLRLKEIFTEPGRHPAPPGDLHLQEAAGGCIVIS